MEMVVGAGGGGVLLHEAVGHGLESDFNRRGTSLYSGRIGERVASELVTIYDDGNLPEERGSDRASMTRASRGSIRCWWRAACFVDTCKIRSTRG